MSDAAGGVPAAGRTADSRRPLRLTVGGAAELVVQLEPGADGGVVAEDAPAIAPLPASADDRAERRQRLEVIVDGWRFEVVAEDARVAALRERAFRAAAAQGVVVRLTVRAQIPGRVTRVAVRPGDHVEAGQPMLAIEAMKMENEIRAPRAGTVESVAVSEGGRVELNDELLALA